MGFRFRKRIKILPGLRLNVGLRGVSATIGRRGAGVNISKRGARGTVGVPGTGLSYSERLTDPPGVEAAPKRRSWLAWLVFIVVVVVACAIAVMRQ